MNVLVVGGAGYIGSHAVRSLLDAGHQVHVFDNLSRGHRAAVPDGLLVEGELTDEILLKQVLQEYRIEAVMHFAAFALVNESIEDPAIYYENNVVATLSLLKAMQETGVNKLVFSSTTAVYGEADKLPVAEDAARNPINPYGFTKLVIEQVLEDYALAYDLGYVTLRYFNAAGACVDGTIGEDHEVPSRLISVALKVALGQRQHVIIYGEDYPTPDGTCIRDYIHVNDLADAHLKALEKIQSGRGLCLNLGTGRGTSVREIITACREVTGHPIPEKVGERREGDPSELVADASLAREVLGWTPEYTDVRSIVETAWRWHQSHPNGYPKS